MFYIGVDLGGTNIATGIMDKAGSIIYKCSVKTLGHRPPAEITKDIAGTILDTIKKTNTDLSDIKGIGVGIPGCMDNKKGRVILTNNMNFSNFDFTDELRKYIDKPIFLGNDANCAALGEMVAGAAKGYSDAIMITIGTGVGGGFVVNKKIYQGFNSAAMEVGHITIDLNGKQCNCGRKGCFELYASANGLVELTKEAIKNNPLTVMNVKGREITGKTAFSAARAGDKTANEVIRQYILYLSAGITDLINLFQPEVFIIGGGISNEGDFLLDKIRENIDTSTYAHGLIPATQIKKAKLGNDAGIIGAGFLAEN